MLADVEEFAHWRVCVRGNLDQVAADAACLFDRFLGVHDTEVLAVLVDYAPFVRLDEFIVAWAAIGGRGQRSAGWTGSGVRSEEGRVGKEWVSTCCSRWSTISETQQNDKINL